MQKRWVEGDVDLQAAADLQQSLQIDKTLARLLIRRGVASFDEAKRFFRPHLSHLHDPFLMQDMKPAIERISKAILLKEKILVYGDYDVDGTTSVALVYSFFKKFHEAIDFYIPDRYKEGYGISTRGIDYAAENNYSLIIALDCGIKSVDKVGYANQLGVDFIICDHHTPGETLPEAVAVLDPKRADCKYPYKELSGCGIGFKLIQAYAQTHNIAPEHCMIYLDLVAVSIASDIVPITGENRVLCWHGLEQLNTNPCKGLAALMEIAGKKERYSITDVVFSIGPRINAAGRIDDARHAVKLLIACEDSLAREASALVNLKNVTRKEHDTQITGQALAMIEANAELMSRKTTVLFDHNWHKGVIGIVASRLTEKYYRPTVVLTHSNGHAAGSARSVLGFDLYEALSSCSDLLEQFGGHKYAAGLTMKLENIAAFQQRFEQVVAETIPDELLVQQIIIDASISLSQITPKFLRILNQFAPFGPMNMAPVFLSRDVKICGSASLVGNNHLKMTVYHNHSPLFDCIGFGMGEYIEVLNKAARFDVCYCIEENTWKEKRSVQLNLKGIRTY